MNFTSARGRAPGSHIRQLALLCGRGGRGAVRPARWKEKECGRKHVWALPFLTHLVTKQQGRSHQNSYRDLNLLTAESGQGFKLQIYSFKTKIFKCEQPSATSAASEITKKLSGFCSAGLQLVCSVSDCSWCWKQLTNDSQTKSCPHIGSGGKHIYSSTVWRYLSFCTFKHKMIKIKIKSGLPNN